jgi:YtkA-like
MKKLTVLVLAILMAATIVYAKDYEVTKKAGDYNVVIKIDKNPPIAGQNNMEVGVTEASGKVVTDAKVLVSYSMPAMTGMPPMSYKAEAQLKGNVYKTTINYSMSGSWNNEIRITRNGKTTSTKFTIDAK